MGRRRWIDCGTLRASTMAGCSLNSRAQRLWLTRNVTYSNIAGNANQNPVTKMPNSYSIELHGTDLTRHIFLRWVRSLVFACIGFLIGNIPFISVSLAKEMISFNSAVLPPTPFMIRISKAQGVPTRQGKPGIALSATLAKPEGEGPFAVVLMFPTCKGWTDMDKDQNQDWRSQIVQWGYVALQVNSVTSRPHIGVNCDPARYDGAVGGTDLLFDGMGALEYLSTLPYIDAERVAVIGWGLGGSGAVKSVNAQGFARLFKRRFKAAVAFYPDCEMHSEYIAPSLVFVGEKDELRPLLCQKMLENTEPNQKHLFTLRIIEGAEREFDIDRM